MLTRFFRTLCLDGAAAPGAGAPPAIPPVSPERRATSMVDRLISRHGSAESALAFMATQAVTAEDTIERLTVENRTLTGRIPAEGSIVLTREQAADMAKIAKLNLTPDQLVAAVQERDTLKTTVTKAEASQGYRAAAKSLGMDEDAFDAHGQREGLVVEMRDTPTVENGKTVTKKLPFVKKGGVEGAEFKPLSDYATGLPAHDQRALKPMATPTPGQPYLPQNPSTTTPTVPTDRVAAELQKINERAKSRPNPLFPDRKPAVATA